MTPVVSSVMMPACTPTISHKSHDEDASCRVNGDVLNNGRAVAPSVMCTPGDTDFVDEALYALTEHDTTAATTGNGGNHVGMWNTRVDNLPVGYAHDDDIDDDWVDGDDRVLVGVESEGKVGDETGSRGRGGGNGQCGRRWRGGYGVDSPVHRRSRLRCKQSRTTSTVTSPLIDFPRGLVKERRKTVRWTAEEVEELKSGVQEFGYGKWATILRNRRFNPVRTSVDLKDKWRNLTAIRNTATTSTMDVGMNKRNRSGKTRVWAKKEPGLKEKKQTDYQFGDVCIDTASSPRTPDVALSPMQQDRQHHWLPAQGQQITVQTPGDIVTQSNALQAHEEIEAHHAIQERQAMEAQQAIQAEQQVLQAQQAIRVHQARLQAEQRQQLPAVIPAQQQADQAEEAAESILQHCIKMEAHSDPEHPSMPDLSDTQEQELKVVSLENQQLMDQGQNGTIPNTLPLRLHGVNSALDTSPVVDTLAGPVADVNTNVAFYPMFF